MVEILVIIGVVLVFVVFARWEHYTARRDMRDAVRQVMESRQRIRERLDRL